MAKIARNRELEFFAALKQITNYQSIASLRRNALKDYGINPEEAIEYAYENILETAKRAIRGYRPSERDAGSEPGRVSAPGSADLTKA